MRHFLFVLVGLFSLEVFAQEIDYTCHKETRFFVSVTSDVIYMRSDQLKEKLSGANIKKLIEEGFDLSCTGANESNFFLVCGLFRRRY